MTTQAEDVRPVLVFDKVADAILTNIRYNKKAIRNNKSILEKRNKVIAVVRE